MKKTATSVLDAWKSDEQAVFIIKKMNDDIAMMKRVQRMGIPKMNAKCLLLSLQLFKSSEDNENEDTLKLIALDEVGSKVNDENICPVVARCQFVHYVCRQGKIFFIFIRGR